MPNCNVAELDIVIPNSRYLLLLVKLFRFLSNISEIRNVLTVQHRSYKARLQRHNAPPSQKGRLRAYLVYVPDVGGAVDVGHEHRGEGHGGYLPDAVESAIRESPTATSIAISQAVCCTAIDSRAESAAAISRTTLSWLRRIKCKAIPLTIKNATKLKHTAATRF